MTIHKDKKYTIQWSDIQKPIEYAKKSETVLLFGGLTPKRERLLQAAAASLGEYYTYLPNPDYKSFEIGKIYGNKAQCNPTYFTVGNLIKYLIDLHEKKGLSKEEIVQKYVHVTVSGCGPCRFGMYITEYKKALRDAGFDGFRVVSFDHEESIFQDSNEEIVEFSPKFFIILIKTTLIADILTLLGDGMRPYELKKGSVNKAIKRCEEIIIKTLYNKKSLLVAMFKCRKILKKVPLDRTQIKPKVMVMGEFWAAMTRSDGNYNLHQYLEEEGAEVISQPLINRILLNIWEAEYKRELVQDLSTKEGLSFSSAKKKILISVAKNSIRLFFALYAKAIGLNWYKLDNMDKLYQLAKSYYPVDSNGGEGHLEVAHLLENIKYKKANLVISIKPFGCMPSSGVSDAIQSFITAKFPEANFISIETSGEGATNFYSRVQMALYKAKEEALAECSNYKPIAIPKYVNDYTFYPKNSKITTAAKLFEEFSKKK